MESGGQLGGQTQPRVLADRVGGQGDGRPDLGQLGGLLEHVRLDAALLQRKAEGQPPMPAPMIATRNWESAMPMRVTDQHLGSPRHGAQDLPPERPADPGTGSGPAAGNPFRRYSGALASLRYGPCSMRTAIPR